MSLEYDASFQFEINNVTFIVLHYNFYAFTFCVVSIAMKKIIQKISISLKLFEKKDKYTFF